MRIPVSAILAALILAEIAGFILVGEAIGVLPTLGLVLARHAGRRNAAPAARHSDFA